MQKVVIVGGGTAGYISALSVAFNGRDKDIQVEVWEDSSVKPLMVGQATIVHLPSFLWAALGVNWYSNELNASPKTGILYEGWGKKQPDFFSSFALNAVGLHLCPWDFRELVRKSGFVIFKDQPVEDISTVDADWIFDCRGMPKDMKGYQDLVSPVNSAILGKPKKCFDDRLWGKAVATPDGWTFEIPTPEDSRSYPYSVGYLYNDTITPENQAKFNFTDLFDVDISSTIKFPSYFKKEPIEGNVFSNGMRLSFIEPLESTSLETYLVWSNMCCDVMWKGLPVSTANYVFGRMMKEIEEYILWHYAFGSKYDTPFWQHASSLMPANSELNSMGEEFNIMKDKWNGDLGKVWMDVATDTDHKEFGLWSFWNIQMWHSAMV
tara:strand:- start:156 stop:1292 length:1137 start_codon:yes stop_codon:yes gene_type:complete